MIAGLGTDLLCHWLTHGIARLGVELRCIGTAGSTGVYALETADDGQRHFSYWRGDGPMATLDVGSVVEHAIGAGTVFLTGITQSLSGACQAATRDLAVTLGSDALIAFDPNVRVEMWKPRGGLDAARAAVDELLPSVGLFLPSAEDCRALWGSEDAVSAAAALSERVEVVVVKDGANGVVVGTAGGTQRVPAPRVAALDTTGAAMRSTGRCWHSLPRGTGCSRPWVVGRAVVAASASTRNHGALSELLGAASGDLAPGTS